MITIITIFNCYEYEPDLRDVGFNGNKQTKNLKNK